MRVIILIILAFYLGGEVGSRITRVNCEKEQVQTSDRGEIDLLLE